MVDGAGVECNVPPVGRRPGFGALGQVTVESQDNVVRNPDTVTKACLGRLMCLFQSVGTLE